jgi:hypothetical protein
MKRIIGRITPLAGEIPRPKFENVGRVSGHRKSASLSADQPDVSLAFRLPGANVEHLYNASGMQKCTGRRSLMLTLAVPL